MSRTSSTCCLTSQDSSGHQADRLLLDSVLVEHQALGSGRGHGSGHEQYEMRLRSPAGADVRAFFKPANGLRQRSLEIFGQTRASCVLASSRRDRARCVIPGSRNWARKHESRSRC